MSGSLSWLFKEVLDLSVALEYSALVSILAWLSDEVRMTQGGEFGSAASSEIKASVKSLVALFTYALRAYMRVTYRVILGSSQLTAY